MADETIEVPAAPWRLPTKEEAAAELARLQAEKDKLVAELQPYRDDYERLVNVPRLIECRAKIKEMSPKIGAIDNLMAALTRVTGGKRLSG